MTKKKILIVEDEFIVANDLRITLTKAGYVIVGIAPSFKEAAVLVDLHYPDLVLLDIHLKGKLTGIDFAGLLQKKNIAFVYLSANSDQQILEAAKATQPYGFLVKPYREKDLLVTLDIAFYRHDHTLASEIRKKKQLEKQLELISVIVENERGKLLQMALALQPHVPFDYLVVGINSHEKTFDEKAFSCHSFLRTAFEQYQEMGESELITISGIHKKELTTLFAASPLVDKAAWYNDNDFKTICRNSPAKRFYAQNFQLQSNIEIPLDTSQGSSYFISLFSRNAHIYDVQHLSILEYLRMQLSGILAGCLFKGKIYNEGGKHLVKNDYGDPSVFKNVIGNSQQILNVMDLVVQVAPLSTSVLLTGESGTGKEVIADCIHKLSDKKDKPFIKVNCAALPPTLIESELFGHEKGSFTGALDRKIGKFEQADGGTIFLDEIGDMALDMQVKLLRVLQEKAIDRIGGQSTIKIDVRIIAATNCNLEKEIAQGKFRLDLYYRINVFPIHLPALRERRQDIVTLSDHFAKEISERFHKPYYGLSTGMSETLQSYSWPGNIRELENTIEQTVILNNSKAPLELKRPLKSVLPAFYATTQRESATSDLKTMTDIRNLQNETEKDFIVAALKKANGKVRGFGGAAEILHLKPTTLESRIAKLGIQKDEYSNNFGG